MDGHVWRGWFSNTNEAIAFGGENVRVHSQPPGIRLRPRRPCDQRCGHIRARHLRKGITAAEAGIHVEDVAAVLGDDRIAVEHADVAEIPADDLSDSLQA